MALGKKIVQFSRENRLGFVEGKHIYSSLALMTWFGSCPLMPQLQAVVVCVPGSRCPECV